MSHDQWLLANPQNDLVDCPLCNGEGDIFEGDHGEVCYECGVCNGSGELTEAEFDAYFDDQGEGD